MSSAFKSEVSSYDIHLTTPDEIVKALPAIFPEWSTATVTVEPIPGGITNRMYKALASNADPHAVIVRIFGSEDVFPPSARARENEVFEQLGRCGLAPRLLALFGNGRLEQHLAARPVTLDEMGTAGVLRGAARAMARLHGFRGGGAPRAWADLEAWAAAAGRMAAAGAFAGSGVDVGAAARGLGRMRARLGGGEEVVFCHNDAVRGNVLLGAGGEVWLVDFEYAGPNFAAFDVGNLFCECMGGTDTGVVQEGRYPDEGVRREFCAEYLAQRSGQAPSSAEVERLVGTAQRFALVAHLYWGFWALVQSAGAGVGGFPYLAYAAARLRLFFAWEARGEEGRRASGAGGRREGGA